MLVSAEGVLWSLCPSPWAFAWRGTGCTLLSWFLNFFNCNLLVWKHLGYGSLLVACLQTNMQQIMDSFLVVHRCKFSRILQDVWLFLAIPSSEIILGVSPPLKRLVYTLFPGDQNCVIFSLSYQQNRNLFFNQVITLPSRINPHQTSAVVSLHGQLFVRAPIDESDVWHWRVEGLPFPSAEMS